MSTRGKTHSHKGSARENVSDEELCVREIYRSVDSALKQLFQCGFVKNQYRDKASTDEFLALLGRGTPITSDQKKIYYMLRMLGGDGVGFANYLQRRGRPAFALWGGVAAICHILHLEDVPLCFDKDLGQFYLAKVVGNVREERGVRSLHKEKKKKDRRKKDQIAEEEPTHAIRMDKVWDNFLKPPSEEAPESNDDQSSIAFATFAATVSPQTVSEPKSAPEPTPELKKEEETPSFSVGTEPIEVSSIGELQVDQVSNPGFSVVWPGGVNALLPT